MVAAAVRQAFLQADAEAARQTWRHVCDQLRPRWPKLATLMDDNEHDVLAYMTFPAQHRAKLHSTNPLERLNKEVKRRADVVGIFPNEASITRLIGAVLLEQNDELYADRGYGRTYTAIGRYRSGKTSTPGGLTDGLLKFHSNLHPLDGRDHFLDERFPARNSLIAQRP